MDRVGLKGVVVVAARVEGAVPEGVVVAAQKALREVEGVDLAVSGGKGCWVTSTALRNEYRTSQSKKEHIPLF